MISKRLVIFVTLVFTMSAANLFAQSAAENFYNLTGAAPAAFRAGDMAKASSLANKLLAEAPKFENDWNYCNAIHVGHLVLGRVALAGGDVKEAKSQLLKSVQGTGGPESTKGDVQFKGSPQMATFGPNMQLAQDLLAKGEKDVVLKYLDLCATFWQKEFSKADEWKSQINKGESPQFGPNLVYGFH